MNGLSIAPAFRPGVDMNYNAQIFRSCLQREALRMSVEEEIIYSSDPWPEGQGN